MNKEERQDGEMFVVRDLETLETTSKHIDWFSDMEHMSTRMSIMR